MFESLWRQDARGFSSWDFEAVPVQDSSLCPHSAPENLG